MVVGLNWQTPVWPAPTNVVARVTTRLGGFSQAPYQGLNLGTHVGDAPGAVQRNRNLLRKQLTGLRRLQWLDQVHGTGVITVLEGGGALRRRTADAACVTQDGDGAVVLTADCLPVLFVSTDGAVAGAAHAGWRGLLDGVLENTVNAMSKQGGAAPASLLAWMGPAIGPCHFEVGAEVRQAFIATGGVPASSLEAAFVAMPERPGKYLMDIYSVARLRLAAAGLTRVYGGGQCTVCDHKNFYSYRRDGVTGRMATLIYLKSC